MKKSISIRVVEKYLERWGIPYNHEIWNLGKGQRVFEDSKENKDLFYKLDIEFTNGVVITKIKDI